MQIDQARAHHEHAARNTNFGRVARLYLNWFEQDAPEGSRLFFPTGIDFAISYFNPTTGVKVSAITYVSQLARERLSHAEANAVIDEASKILGLLS